MVAKFMNFYHYKWCEIMEPFRLPFAVFVGLYEMIDRVHADKALEIDIATSIATTSGNFNFLEEKRGHVFTLITEKMTPEDKVADMKAGNEKFRKIRQIEEIKFEKGMEREALRG